MQLVSVNVGRAQPIAAKSGMSGIFKLPDEDTVWVSVDGLRGDVIVDTENHGGVDQAVYIYTAEDYAWWEASLGRQLAPGIFGENLLIAGLESAALSVGDRFRIGDVLLEVTSPRVPCVTLATRMGDPQFVKKFMQAKRPGVYCRVLEAGVLRAGDAVVYTPYTGERVSAVEMMRFDLARRSSAEGLHRLLRAPVAIRARRYYEELLAVREAVDFDPSTR